ncbi:MAG: sulfocyanin-like copper-binding protein [Geminicoccaceae bacterium]
MARLGPLLAGGLLAAALPAAAQQAPSWLKVDAAAQKVELDVVAAFNDTNSNWNFNGFHNGNATIVVPTGWTVAIPFHNQEDGIAHSLVVIADPGDEMEYPDQVDDQAAAFHGAHSAAPTKGLEKGGTEDLSFKADKAGSYLWYCGVPGHGNAGMWIRFQVADGAKAPAVTIAADAEPGRS